MSEPPAPAGDVITCPGCARPLHVPRSAVGGPAHCPHCRTAFRLPANPDGSPGTPVLTRRASWAGIPKALIGPGFALLMVGAMSATVNGVLLARFQLVPGADLAHARWQVAELRNQEIEQAMKEEAKKKDKDAPPAPRPDTSAADEELARAWVPRLVPFHAASLALGVAAAVGGLCTLAGRFYPLALLGCLAAALNVNYFCCVPGFAAGAWTALMIVRDEGRRHFGKVG